VNVGILSGRLTAVPIKSGRLSLLLGGGVDHMDAHFFESYGFHGLAGVKIALAEMVALRVDGVRSYMANGGGWNNALHLGLSLYRTPTRRTNTVTNTVTRTVTMNAPQRPDSVSAAETRRLRAAETRYQALRDSLAWRPTGPRPVSSADRSTMMETIHFRNDRSDLSDAARALLRDKVEVFRDNPALRIVITGYASSPGTEPYNMALGLERAEAAQTYLVAWGVAADRIEIATRGEGQLVIAGPGEVAATANRRGEFRLLVAEAAGSGS
jgi:outer membrane protein OmpA-like peptidoglycan-associated protein